MMMIRKTEKEEETEEGSNKEERKTGGVSEVRTVIVQWDRESKKGTGNGEIDEESVREIEGGRGKNLLGGGERGE